MKDERTGNQPVRLPYWTAEVSHAQVLADGTNIYLDGAGRIAQENTAGMQYFLGDAQRSVRQLADRTGELRLGNSYEPYGEMLSPRVTWRAATEN